MKIALLGGSGFLGRALLKHFLEKDFSVTLFSRNPKALRRQLEADAVAKAAGAKALAFQEWECSSFKASPAKLGGLLSGHSVVVNLMGAPLQRRWNRAVKQGLVESRVGTTKVVAAALAHTTPPPKVWVNASAIGYYESESGKTHSEAGAAGSGFLSMLCRDWEVAAVLENFKEASRVRIALLRIGIVLGREAYKNTFAGALEKMVPAFRWGLGGSVGGGEQGFAWIRVEDFVKATQHIITTPTLQGPINLVSPAAVSLKTFTTALGKAVRRPTFFNVPAMVLKLLLGEGAALILKSPLAKPTKLLESGYQFQFPALDEALSTLFEKHKK